MDLAVEQIQDADHPQWDSYVVSHADGTFFHLSGWRTVIEQSFGQRTYFLVARQGSDIVGVLPLAYLKSPIFGNYLVSTPFCVYGGVLADSEAACDVLIQHACDLAKALNVESLELRNRRNRNSSWPVKELYFTFRKEISADTDMNLAAIPRKQRAMVRKSIAAGLKGEEDSVNAFYEIYSESVRNLGTPVYGKKYFRMLKSVFGSACDVRIIRREKEPVAAVMSFFFRDEVLPYYGGGRPVARQLKANDFMYWDLMCHAVQRGSTLFDFGRSKIDTGPYNFKKNWGFEPQPLPYEFYLVRATEVPRIDPTNPKYKRFIELWKHLPLFLANAVGPFVSRNLG